MFSPDPEQIGFAAGAAGAGTDTGGDAVGVGVTDVGAVVETAVAVATGAAEVVDADGEGVAGTAAGVDVLAGSTFTAGAAPSFFIPFAMVPAPVGALLAGAAPSVLLPQAARTSAAARSANAFADVIVPPQVAVDCSAGRLGGRGQSSERNGVLVPRFTIGGDREAVLVAATCGRDVAPVDCGRRLIRSANAGIFPIPSNE